VLLDYMYKDSSSKGYITIEELRLADEVYSEYHSLGGNSTGTAIHRKIHELPNEKIQNTKDGGHAWTQ
ncbi:MAG: hypothetical protein K6F09_04115, partial [Clostridiales bacterium]|nr:hypothetical protein [Clostridiales bacterium]